MVMKMMKLIEESDEGGDGDVEDDLEDALCDLHDPGLEGEGDGGVAGAELDLHQTPDT